MKAFDLLRRKIARVFKPSTIYVVGEKGKTDYPEGLFKTILDSGRKGLGFWCPRCRILYKDASTKVFCCGSMKELDASADLPTVRLHGSHHGQVRAGSKTLVDTDALSGDGTFEYSGSQDMDPLEGFSSSVGFNDPSVPRRHP